MYNIRNHLHVSSTTYIYNTNHDIQIIPVDISKDRGCSFCAENTCRCTTFRIVRSCGALEILRLCQLGVDFELLTLDTAGDFGIGTFLEEEEISILKTQELKHGRLAMIAFGGAITQAVACNAHHFPFIPCSTC